MTSFPNVVRACLGAGCSCLRIRFKFGDQQLVWLYPPRRRFGHPFCNRSGHFVFTFFMAVVWCFFFLRLYIYIHIYIFIYIYIHIYIHVYISTYQYPTKIKIDNFLDVHSLFKWFVLRRLNGDRPRSQKLSEYLDGSAGQFADGSGWFGKTVAVGEEFSGGHLGAIYASISCACGKSPCY